MGAPIAFCSSTSSKERLAHHVSRQRREVELPVHPSSSQHQRRWQTEDHVRPDPDQGCRSPLLQDYWQKRSYRRCQQEEGLNDCCHVVFLRWWLGVDQGHSAEHCKICSGQKQMAWLGFLSSCDNITNTRGSSMVSGLL